MYDVGNYVKFRQDGEIGQLNKEMYSIGAKNIVYVIIQKNLNKYTLKAVDDTLFKSNGLIFQNVFERQFQPVPSDIKFKNIKVGQYIKTLKGQQLKVFKIENYVIEARDSFGQYQPFSMITGKQRVGTDGIEKILSPWEINFCCHIEGTIREYDQNNIIIKSNKDGKEYIISKDYISKTSCWSSQTPYEFMEEILEAQREQKNNKNN